MFTALFAWLAGKADKTHSLGALFAQAAFSILLIALIELASFLKLLLYISIIACVFVPWGVARPDAAPAVLGVGVGAYLAKLAVAGFLLAFFETSVAKMRVFRVPVFLGAALMLALLATLLMFVTQVR